MNNEFKAPQWCTGLVLLSTILTKPISIVAYLPLFVGIYKVSNGYEGDSTGLIIKCAIFSLIGLALLVYETLSRMNKDGVLEEFLSISYATKPFPMWLKRNFCK